VIVAFSTSSSLASVALIDPGGKVIASAEEWAPMAASGACLTLLRELLKSQVVDIRDADLFLSDLGPGSFTGVKVGVTMAKTFAYANGKKAGGARSFDLIDPQGLVVLPSKRGEWFVREPGHEPQRQSDLPTHPFKGYGADITNPTYPRADRFAGLLDSIHQIQPELLVPEYLIDPSISIPKTPYRSSVTK
jgi:tRNA threonylcarbamoyl adenosine modification protein YeaZ